jgi:hypothetical protein
MRNLVSDQMEPGAMGWLGRVIGNVGLGGGGLRVWEGGG